MKSFSFVLILLILHGAVGQQEHDNSTGSDIDNNMMTTINQEAILDDVVNDDVVVDDDIYYDYFYDNTQDSEEEDDDDIDNTTYSSNYNKILAYMENEWKINEKNAVVEDSEEPSKLFVVKFQDLDEISEEISEEDSDEELVKELRELFENTPSDSPSNEQPHDNVIITNIELNVVNVVVSDQPISNGDDQLPINVIYEESYNKDNQTGLLLNFNFNLSEEKTILALAVLGIIISSVFVTVFLARLQSRRLEKMSAIPSPLNDEQTTNIKYQLMDTDSMEQGLPNYKLFGK